MSKKEMYIHIGMPKTGSSALQTFFVENRKLLEQRQIIYPCCTRGRIDHHYLGWSLLNKTRDGEVYPADVKSSSEEWKSILSQLGANYNIISTELLHRMQSSMVAELKEYVSDYDVKIVLYLRRHDHWLNSLYNQRIKGRGVQTLPVEDVQADPLQIWSNFFSINQIIVRPYEKEQFFQGNIYADFLYHTVGLKLNNEFFMPPIDINSRLHRIIIEYKRMLNCIPFPNGKKGAVPVHILRELSKLFFDKNRKDYSVFSPHERLEIIESNMSRYAEIAKTYLGRKDGQLFYEPLPDVDEDWQPYECLLEEDAKLINQYLLEHHHHIAKRIYEGIEVARKSDDSIVQNAAKRLMPGYRRTNKPCSIITSKIEAQKCESKLYLHIGIHKTGTTALQQFFASNRDVLKKHGVVYPYDITGGGEGGHFRLFWSLQADRGRTGEKFSSNLKCAVKEWEYILAQCSYPKTIISAEGLWLCLRGDMERIKQLLSGFQVYVVVYLRRQDEMTVSRYNQVTKAGRVWTDSLRDSYPDYEEGLKRWSEVFGKKNIIVRPYEKQQFYQGSIFSDFLHYVLGLEMSESFDIPKEAINPSLHQIALEYKKLINCLPLSLLQKDAILTALQNVSEIFYREGRANYSVLSPLECLQIIQEHSEANSRIAREYLGRPDGRLFYDPLPDTEGLWQPYSLLTESDARCINQYLAEHSPDVFYAVVEGITEAMSSGDMNLKNAIRRLLPGIVEPALSDKKCQDALQQKLAEPHRLLTSDTKRVIKSIYPKIPVTLARPLRTIARKLYKYI